MFRIISPNYRGEYLGDVELGVRVMVDLTLEATHPLAVIAWRVDSIRWRAAAHKG